MKKWIGVLIAAALIAGGCDDLFGDSSNSDGSSTAINIGGEWDMVLVPNSNTEAVYTVTVEVGGGSGTARISIVGPLVLDSATVVAGDSIPIGECGLVISFGAPAEAIDLMVGDSWAIQVVAAIPLPPAAAPDNTSVVSSVDSGGLDCVPETCNGSALASAVSIADPGGGGGLAVGGQWFSVRLGQSGPTVTGYVPEEHVMNLNLGAVLFPPSPTLVAPGDSVTVSFRRRAIADGQKGDFFRAVVINEADTPDIDYLLGSALAGGDTVVSLTFTANSDKVSVQFIAGLSDPGEAVMIDDVLVTVAGTGTVFSDGFESGPNPGSCGPNNSRWRLGAPAWQVGNLCVSAAGALTGSYSARWSGGSYRVFINSSVLGGGGSGDLASLLGGGASAFGSSLTGAFLEASEPTYTGYLTSFFITTNGAGTIVGTFRGESSDHTCIESGTITGTKHVSVQPPAASGPTWVVHLSGQAANCLPAAGSTITFDYLLTTLAGDTHIPMTQAGMSFSANDPVFDPDTNQYLMSGAVAGTVFTVNFVSAGGTATGTGAVSSGTVTGALTGKLLFDSGRVCNIAPGGAFEATPATP